jgi:ribulose-phosphate 3-epimerase
MPSSVKIAPSLLNASITGLSKEIEMLEQLSPKPDWLHVDVMDGHFVPNLTVGPGHVRAVKAVCSIPLDVHLMVDNPAMQLDWYLDAGADMLTVHVESHAAAITDAGHVGAVSGRAMGLRRGSSYTIGDLTPAQTDELKDILARCRKAGVMAGVALNPDTPAEVLRSLAGCFDAVLVMSVHPGFGGQGYIPAATAKVERLAAAREAMASRLGPEAPSFLIEVDGGINAENAALPAAAGADILVAGNAIFTAADRPAAYAAIHAAANDAA